MRLAALGVVVLGWGAAGCGGHESHEPARIAITTAIANAELYVDAHPRGRLADGTILELPPGAHVLEARRGRRIVARRTLELHPGDRRTEALDERPYREREVPRGRRPRR